MNKKNIVSYLTYHKNEFSTTEQIIVNYFLNKSEVQNLKITDLSEEIFVSTATISRFVNKVGFRNYKEFLYVLQNSLDEIKSLEGENKEVTQSLWHVHKDYFIKIYENVSKIDLNDIANKISRSKLIYTFGFGKAQDMTEMLSLRLETIKPGIKNVSHLEHMLYSVENGLNYENLVIVFYQHNHFQKDVELLIDLCQKKFIPIIIISLSADLDTKNYASLYKFYPQIDATVPIYSTTMYAPDLIFIDSLYSTIEKKMKSKNQSFEDFY